MSKAAAVGTSVYWDAAALTAALTHYEQLVFKGQLILQLHSFKIEHHHGPIGNENDKPYGNGVLLWFEVEDFDAVMEPASELGVEIVLPRHRNPPDGGGGPNHWECWMRDLDGYTVVVASPYAPQMAIGTPIFRSSAQTDPDCRVIPRP